MKKLTTMIVVALSVMVLSACDFFGEEVVKSGSSNVASNNDNSNNVNNTNNSNNTNNANNTNETNNTNVELCGNGVLDQGELCDSVANDGSLAEEIHFAPGSLTHNCADDEEPVFDCNSSCNVVVECVPDNNGTEDPYCGDGEVNQSSEECDGSVSDSCESLYGANWTGTVSCSANCQKAVDCVYNPSATATCGNGIVESGEACDGGTNQTCESLYGAGYVGTVSCNSCAISASCIYNPSATATCGNGIIESGESCEGSNFNGATCSSYGFTSGSLSCNSCQISTASCSNVVQNQDPVVCLQADSGFRAYGMVVTMDGQVQWFSKNPGEVICGRQIKFNAQHTTTNQYMIGYLQQCSIDLANYDMVWNAVQVWVNPAYGTVVDNTSCPSGQVENYSVAGTTKKVCGSASYGVVSDNSVGGGINLLIGELGSFQLGQPEPNPVAGDYYVNCTPGEEKLYWGQNNSVPHP